MHFSDFCTDYSLTGKLAPALHVARLICLTASFTTDNASALDLHSLYILVVHKETYAQCAARK